MDFAALGWRDAVLVLVALAAVYLVLLVLRLFKVGRRHAAPVVAAETDFSQREAPTVDLSGPGLDLLAEIAAEAERQENLATREPPMASNTLGSTRIEAAANEWPPGGHVDFSRELSRTTLESEVQQLRRESGLLRDEIERLRDELTSLRASRNVSPLYNEAMSLAQAGVAADGIAGQCGISLAEAQLVAAMARGRQATDDDEQYPLGEDYHGASPGPGTRTGTHG